MSVGVFDLDDTLASLGFTGVWARDVVVDRPLCRRPRHHGGEGKDGARPREGG